MNLVLPPDRRLEDGDAMLDRILSGETPADRPASRTRWAVAVAAAVVLVATALGLAAHGDRSGQLADPPVSSASPDPSASPVPSVAPVAPVPPVSSATGHQPYPTNPVHLRIPTTVSFPHVSAAVLSAGPLRVNGAPVDEYVVRVRTCVRSAPAGATNISARLTEADWSLTTSSGRVTVDDPIRSPVPLTTTYPPTGDYPVGTCVSGTIPFGVGRSATVTAIRYTNNLGDAASWTPRS